MRREATESETGRKVKPYFFNRGSPSQQVKGDVASHLLAVG